MKTQSIHLTIAENSALYDSHTQDLIDTLKDINVIAPTRMNGQYKKLLSHYPEIVQDIEDATRFMPAATSIMERIMLIIERFGDHPKCRGCHQPTTFNTAAKRWNRYCNSACPHMDDDNTTKRLDSLESRYGVRVPLQSSEIRKHMVDTCNAKYGADHFATTLGTHLSNLPVETRRRYRRKAAATIRARHEGATTHAQTLVPSITLEMLSNNELMREAIDDHTGTRQEFFDHWGISDTTFYRYAAGHGITDFTWKKYTMSRHEREVLDFIRANTDLNVVSQHKIAGGRHTSDVYIPALNTHIEVDGVYWHSELRGRDSTYHRDKRNLDKDARWVGVYDVEWDTKRDIVESRLKSLLGATERIGARKCQVVSVSSHQARAFFATTHLQGPCPSRFNYGLMADGTLVAVMSFGASRFTSTAQYELLRYSSALGVSVVGGASRLFNAFVKQQAPVSVVSYCDLRVGTGNMYHQLGFTLDGVSNPNYKYFNIKGRQPYTLHNRMQFQKHKLAAQFDTFDPSLTEWDNMRLAGWDRIWDVGNARFLWRS